MRYMKRALALATEALGRTSPNPAVGAVVVKDGLVVGEGFTLPPGQAHAEVRALEQAGPRTRGAVLYITLEPCCIFGRTPPCTQAIISAGISEVHMAVEDPNPKVSGRGRAELEASGITVHSGEEADEASQLYEAYTKHVRTGLPFVIAKFAASLDGKIATSTGASRWITGTQARRYAQELRRVSDAIMVGINTVVRDDPQLTARDAKGAPLPRQPLRVIVDSHARTPPDARVLKEPGQTMIATTREDVSEQRPGVEVQWLPQDQQGFVDLDALLETLGKRGVVSLLVEGGGDIMGSLFDRCLVDRVVAFIAPVVIGGKDAPSPVAGKGARAMTEVMRLERVKVKRLGEDILIAGYPVRGT